MALICNLVFSIDDHSNPECFLTRYNYKGFNVKLTTPVPNNFPRDIDSYPTLMAPFMISSADITSMRKSYTFTGNGYCVCESCSDLENYTSTELTFTIDTNDNSIVSDARSSVAINSISISDNNDDDSDSDDELTDENSNSESDNEFLLQIITDIIAQDNRIGQLHYNSHYDCKCQNSENVCGCGCDPAHDGW